MTEQNQTTIIAEPGKQEMVITREFDAPRELVFKAFTNPQLVPQWWGPRYLTTLVDKMDVRPGGQWRFIHRDAEGNEFAFHGVYHEILAPERIIDTFEFEGLPETGHVTLETMKLEELPGGRTRLVTQSVFQSIADRDGALQSGMESGINDTYNRLEELLEKM
ncbi:MAG: SRPBCC family protein [Ktedonobacteraceae bacterium]